MRPTESGIPLFVRDGDLGELRKRGLATWCREGEIYVVCYGRLVRCDTVADATALIDALDSRGFSDGGGI